MGWTFTCYDGMDISIEHSRSSDHISDVSHVSPKRNRHYKTKSNVWDHFTKIKKDGGGLANKATYN